MHLSASEGEDEDEDVAYERTRVSSGDVGEDMLVLQDLTKVKLFTSFKFIFIIRDHIFLWAVEFRAEPRNLPFAAEFPYFH